ncbi:MAG: hypothetical protein F8N15_08500 [Methanobacterium sp.]|nr:hypothetical protein [Methanobacterium sp.]
MPDNYVSVPTDKGGGTKYVDPNNPHNYVRDMPGNPNSPNPAQQNLYVVDMRSGTARDLNGNSVSPKTPDAHIPANQYWYVP